MKHILITTIAAVLVVGCGPTIRDAAFDGNIEAVKQHLDAGADVNAKNDKGNTPLDVAEEFNLSELASILRKHGAKKGN